MGVRASLGLAVSKGEAPATPSTVLYPGGRASLRAAKHSVECGSWLPFSPKAICRLSFTRLCYKVRKAAESHRTPYKFGSGGKSSAVGVHELNVAHKGG
jgi:hypothetical protein